MKRIILTLLSFLTIFLAFPKTVSSEEQFKSYLNTEYLVDEKGHVTVTQNITLENLTTGYYATSYSITLEGIAADNPKAYQDGRLINLVRTEEDGKVILSIKFDDDVVGKGKKRIFSIVFSDNSIVTKTGEIWELLIPKVNSDTQYATYTVTLDVPKSFGEVAYMTPDATNRNITGGNSHFVFENDSGARSGISAAFGQFQVFEFNLTYHLENPLAKIASTEIAIPPDTAFQKVNYQMLDPKPADVRIDEDGNWLAKYNLLPKQRIDVKTQGAVQLFASERKFPGASVENLNANLKSTSYWQTTDPKIIELSKRLRTPRAIYNYVTSALAYDYDRVQPNVSRLGATAAIQNPNNAICTEFTDLFIAIARAAGIPAREINGFAYTENPQIQPLSLVADVLHAWPEYWDSSKKVWVPVDPTWGSTTGGINFFDNLDLRHFAFVIHGSDATKPYPPGSYKLGANPQKDVFVSFGKLPEKRNSLPEVKTRTSGGILFLGLKVNAEVINPGPVGLYDEVVKIYFDQKLEREFKIDRMPVYGKYNFTVDIPYGFFGQGTPEKVLIVIGGQTIEIPTYKVNFIIANVSIVLVGVFVLTFLTYLKIRKYLSDRKKK